MLTVIRYVNILLTAAVFVTILVLTNDMGFIAWVFSFVGAIVVYLLVHAVVMAPTIRRAAGKVSQDILRHFAAGGDMAGAVEIAKRLGLSEEAALRVAESHRDLLVQEAGRRVLLEAVTRYRKSGDRDEVRRYLLDQGVGESEIDDALDLVVENAAT